MTDSALSESQAVEPIGPSLHLGGVGMPRATWLGPAWALLCGLIASAAFTFDGPGLLVAALAFIVADWTWPALWTTCVRSDWLAPIARWPEVSTAQRPVSLPYLQPDSPGERTLKWAARFGAWWRSAFAPAVGSSVVGGLAALVIALALSAAIGWRALALTLAVLALTGLGVLHALRTALDSDGLRAAVYGVLPWWLGHAAFAPLSAESAGAGALFGLVYWAMMRSGERAPSPIGLIVPQLAAAVALFGSGQPAAGFVVGLAIVGQVALRTFLVEAPFARRAQAWLMLSMLACAIAIA